jgi:putative transposase
MADGSAVECDHDRRRAIRGHLDRVVRGTVEETLNALLDAEADRLCNAQRYERTEARRDTRAGHYERRLLSNGSELLTGIWSAPPEVDKVRLRI